MTIRQAQQLHSRDQVFWNDPDGGLCSRQLTILTIRLEGNVAFIQDLDGSNLQCFVSELS